jgi:ribosomal protein L40E
MYVKAPGKNFILVPGIILLVFGAISFIGYLVQMTAADYFIIFTFFGNIEVSAGVFFIHTVIDSGWHVVFGIVAIRLRNDYTRTTPLKVLSIIDIIYLFYALISNPSEYIIFTLPMVVLPILILVGAAKNANFSPPTNTNSLLNRLAGNTGMNSSGSKKCKKCLTFYEGVLHSCPECGFRASEPVSVPAYAPAPIYTPPPAPVYVPSPSVYAPPPLYKPAAVICDKCNTSNDIDAKFCKGCAASLTWACNKCSVINDSDAKFCKGCGTQGIDVTPADTSPHTPPASAPN